MNLFDLVVVQPIFNLLMALYSVIPGGDFGIAIVIFTIFVRFALYPLVKRQLHQVKAMRKLQPELKRIKKATKGNKQQESVQMMELYKKHGVNPFRSILILLIQLPIFIGLYHVIQIFTIHRDQLGKYTYDFLEHNATIAHIISNPGQFNLNFLGFVDLTKAGFSNTGIDIFIVILAVISAGTQYIMSKQTMPQTESKKRLRDIMAEAADGKTADQGEMNAVVMGKMMKFLPIMMFFIMVSVPGAIALYYGVSNMVAVAQQHYLLNKDKEELEEIADEPSKQTGKKATAKARAKVASEGNVIRITAKDTKRKL